MKDKKKQKEDTDEGLDLVPLWRGEFAFTGLLKDRLEAEGIPAFFANEYSPYMAQGVIDGPYLLVPRRDVERARALLDSFEEEVNKVTEQTSCLDCDSTDIIEAKMTFWERLTVRLDGGMVLRCRKCGYRWKK